MTDTRRSSSIVFSLVVVMLMVAAGTSYLAGRSMNSSARIIAFPSELQESSVLAALALVDIDNAIGASTAFVPLSDFSRIIAVTFQNASQRVLSGDPRRTPFLVELTYRFSTPGPGDAPWTVIYLPGPTRTRDEATARALTSLSPAWAWDGMERASGSHWFVLPALIWAVWLVLRNPRRDRFKRLLWVVSFLPLLLGSRPGGSLLFIALSAACTITSQYVLSGATPRALSRLWPYAIVTIALLIYEPDSLPYSAASLIFAGVAAYLGPLIERYASRKRLHAAPAFRTLTMSGVHGYVRRINRVLLVPFAVIIISIVLAPVRAGQEIADAPRFRIERAVTREHRAANTLFEEHLAFQRAITYGRLGDFSLENTSYTPVFRYREEEGRMKRTDDSGDSMSDWPAATFKAAIKVLLDEGPGSILPKIKK